jgi:hypothetical protein
MRSALAVVLLKWLSYPRLTTANSDIVAFAGDVAGGGTGAATGDAGDWVSRCDKL